MPLFWPNEHHQVNTASVSSLLSGLCSFWYGGLICKAAKLPANFEALAEEYKQELGHIDY